MNRTLPAPPNVIVDLDGTLVDSLPGIEWSVNEALSACGLPPAANLRPLIGPPIRDILSAVVGLPGAGLLDRLERRFRLSYDTEGWRRTVCQPGVPDMLWRLLTAGAGLWVVTNKPAFSAGRILDGLKIASFFREVICRDSRIPPFASKAAMLRDLLDRRGLNRAETLMVGDTAEDANAAGKAGIRCVLVPHGYGGRDSRYISGWDELLDILQVPCEVNS